MNKNLKDSTKNIDQDIIDLILDYIIQPNTTTEDDVAKYIEVQTDGEITADNFHDWIMKFDAKTIK